MIDLPCQNSEGEVCQVGGPRAVARPAADDQAAIGAAALGYFLHVVGGQVGRGVGGAAFPPRAPVTDDGAVVRHHAASALALGVVVVEVGSACPLGQVLHSLAVRASGLASYWPLAAEAGAEQVSHRRLRLRRTRSLRWHGWQRSPGPTNWL